MIAGLSIGFGAPLVLLALLSLPIVIYLLRALPPPPQEYRFSAVTLLLGLKDKNTQADRTPWWLLMLRIMAVGALILGLADPFLNQQPSQTQAITGAKLIVMDGSWAGAPRHEAKLKRLRAELQEAQNHGQTAGILQLSAPKPLVFQTPSKLLKKLPQFSPNPWLPSDEDVQKAIATLQLKDVQSVVWISDGLAFDGHDKLLAHLRTVNDFKVYQDQTPIMALTPLQEEAEGIKVKALRAQANGESSVPVLVRGLDPSGQSRILAQTSLTFEAQALSAHGLVKLPTELRARVRSFELAQVQSAGAKLLVDDTFARKEVALVSRGGPSERADLLSPLHYLRQALRPSVDLIEGDLGQVMPANPDVIVLADVIDFTPHEKNALQEWVVKGGTLLRFAGPKMAASEISRQSEDPLMPVRLRVGGRSVGGAMSWGAPKAIAAFQKNSPFFGLSLPDDVWINTQVIAQTDPSLAERVIAQLDDGTPLVTRKEMGEGRVILVHVTANAAWSSLPLSGLFVDMLGRMIASSSIRSTPRETIARTTWQLQEIMDGFGQLQQPKGFGSISGEKLLDPQAAAQAPAGLYRMNKRIFARNVLLNDEPLNPVIWPDEIVLNDLKQTLQVSLMAPLLIAAMMLLFIDILASAILSRQVLTRVGVMVLAVGFWPFDVPHVHAQGALDAQWASEFTLAYVKTGNERVDQISHAGLRGLSMRLFERTSVEPKTPVAISLEKDELALFPLIYWPIHPDQIQPSTQAYEKVNAYLRSGGMIVFDTRDFALNGENVNGENARKLRALAAPLHLPKLERVPHDHVLTRSYYLIDSFPGRYSGATLWVEASLMEEERREGQAFRRLNDGVTPVIIGGNDWASAWALTEQGRTLYPVGRGFAGERQRELAFRFGINLVMYVLTGNYKSDQVHVPELLKRLGQ